MFLKRFMYLTMSTEVKNPMYAFCNWIFVLEHFRFFSPRPQCLLWSHRKTNFQNLANLVDIIKVYISTFWFGLFFLKKIFRSLGGYWTGIGVWVKCIKPLWVPVGGNPCHPAHPGVRWPGLFSSRLMQQLSNPCSGIFLVEDIDCYLASLTEIL